MVNIHNAINILSKYSYDAIMIMYIIVVVQVQILQSFFLAYVGCNIVWATAAPVLCVCIVPAAVVKVSSFNSNFASVCSV